jgi:thioredoxin 1
MKGIIKIAKRLMLVFLALVASSTMFLTMPAVAASSSISYVDDRTFDTEVLKSGEPVVVDFCASWAGPCRQLAPIVEGIARDYLGRIKVYQLDIDEAPTIAQKYGIRSVPTLGFFKDGSQQNRISGLASREKIISTFGIR